VTLVKTFFMGL